MSRLKSHPTRIDLKPKVREQVIDLLNAQLADTLDLRTQTKQAHWNVKGPHFIALHELFDKLAGDLDGPLDDIAERITALGGIALGTARIAAKESRLKELPHDGYEGLKLIALLVDRYAALAASTRAAIDAADEVGDADTADLFTGVSRGLDKSLWFLQAHLY